MRHRVRSEKSYVRIRGLGKGEEQTHAAEPDYGHALLQLTSLIDKSHGGGSLHGRVAALGAAQKPGKSIPEFLQETPMPVGRARLSCSSVPHFI